jgi:endonuclease YncB( thermonuclease family)
MSRHWEPPRRPWTRADAYIVRGGRGSGGGRLPDGAKAGLVLVAAACVGIAIGAYQAFGPRHIVADEVAAPQKQEKFAPAFDPRLPQGQPAGDVEWAARGRSPVIATPGTDRGEATQPGLPRSSSAGNDALRLRSGRAVAGVRASFGYCKWGGGTNCVVDGDTFWIGGQKVRIADIDAPETHDYRCRSELELGERAARDLQALLNSGAVTMTSIDRDRDVYGRLLRNVSVNGQDVGEALISAGVARAYGRGRRPWC